MSNIVDKILRDVSLDERISDGIFRMEEETHMDALRDYFVKKGIAKEAAISVTNRMVEGKYPDRQAYRSEDGILVTWPSPQHKKKAMQENPGKYVEQNPFPKSKHEEEPAKQERPDLPPKKEIEPKPKPDDDSDDGSGRRPNNLFGGGSVTNAPVQQGDKQLAVEPIRGAEPPTPLPHSPVAQPVPRTPERVATEKEIVKQIMKNDDTTLSNVADPINEELLKHQMREMYKKCDEWAFREMEKFLAPFVRS